MAENIKLRTAQKYPRTRMYTHIRIGEKKHQNLKVIT